MCWFIFFIKKDRVIPNFFVFSVLTNLWAIFSRYLQFWVTCGYKVLTTGPLGEENELVEIWKKFSTGLYFLVGLATLRIWYSQTLAHTTLGIQPIGKLWTSRNMKFWSSLDIFGSKFLLPVWKCWLGLSGLITDCISYLNCRFG